MGHRILSRDEMDALSPGAIQFIYEYIIDQHCSPDVIEKTLMQAVMISRIEQCKIDEEGIAFLFERMCENDGAMFFDANAGEWDSSRYFC